MQRTENHFPALYPRSGTRRRFYAGAFFSDERLRLYTEEKPECPYAYCPVGMSMEFVTDAKTVSFSYRMTKIYYPVIVFDVYENGLFTRAVREPDGSEKRHGGIHDSDAGRGCGDLLPHRRGRHLYRYTDWQLQNGEPCARTEAAGARRPISQGLFGVNPSVSVVPLLARHYGYDYLNLSVGGEVFRPDLVEPELDYRPDRILVELWHERPGIRSGHT